MGYVPRTPMMDLPLGQTVFDYIAINSMKTTIASKKKIQIRIKNVHMLLTILPILNKVNQSQKSL